MSKKKYIVSIIGKQFFNDRMHIRDQQHAEFIYDQYIAFLELVGEEVNTNISDLRIGVYLDTKNEGVRYFELEEAAYGVFYDNLGHRYINSLKEFAKREQKKGTNVLFQLNNGNISMKDFEEQLK